jgi:hypothetical protein
MRGFDKLSLNGFWLRSTFATVPFRGEGGVAVEPAIISLMPV